MEDRFIRATEITRKAGLSLSTIWRLERDGDFPRRRSLGRKAVGWVKSEVDMRHLSYGTSQVKRNAIPVAEGARIVAADD